MSGWASAIRSADTRRTLAFPLVLLPGLVAAVVAAALYGELSVSGGLGGLVGTIFVIAVFLIPFVPIAVALSADLVGPVGSVLAFAVAAASFAVVPWVVDRLIADDTNSTAGLLHLYDPVLDTLSVAVVVGFAAILRKSFRRVA